MVRTHTVFSATACAVAVVLAVAGITQSADTEPVPASPHGTLAIEQVPGFSDFALYWLGTSFEGLPLTRIVSAAPVPPRGGPGDVPAGPGPTRAVSFTYGACRGASCTPPLRVLVRPACAVEAARPAEAARRLHVRGVPVVARGDRYILRLPSPSQTLGGGRVAEPHPARHRRFRPEVIAGLEALARGTPADLLMRALHDGLPHAWGAALAASGLPPGAAAEALAALTAAGKVVALAEGNTPAHPDVILPPRHLVTHEGWQKLSEKLREALAGYHRRYPLRASMPREELRSRLKLGGEACDALVAEAAARGLAEAGEGGVRLAGHVPRPSPEQQRLMHRWLDALAAAPYAPPPPDLDSEVIGMLVEQGAVARVAPDVLFLSEAYREMVDWVRAQVAGGATLTLAEFRDRFGTSRKYAQAVLEHLDERKVTRRVGDARVRY